MDFELDKPVHKLSNKYYRRTVAVVLFPFVILTEVFVCVPDALYNAINHSYHVMKNWWRGEWEEY